MEKYIIGFLIGWLLMALVSTLIVSDKNETEQSEQQDEVNRLRAVITEIHKLTVACFERGAPLINNEEIYAIQQLTIKEKGAM